MPPSAIARLLRHQHRSQLGVWCQHAIEADQLQQRTWHRCGEPLQVIKLAGNRPLCSGEIAWPYGSNGSAGGLRLAGWTAAKRSASGGQESSAARLIRSAARCARAWSAAHEWSAVFAFKRRGSDSAQKRKRDWISSGALWCGATVERLLVGSKSRSHSGASSNRCRRKNLSISPPESDARFAVRDLVFSRTMASRRRPCFRGYQTAV